MINEVATDSRDSFRLVVLVGKPNDGHFAPPATRLGSDGLFDSPRVLTCDEKAEIQNALVAALADLKGEFCCTRIVAGKASDPVRMRLAKTVDALVIIPGNEQLYTA